MKSKMVQSVDPTVERSLRGPQDFEFSEVMRPSTSGTHQGQRLKRRVHRPDT
jgi:hypothetical protein